MVNHHHLSSRKRREKLKKKMEQVSFEKRNQFLILKIHPITQYLPFSMKKTQRFHFSPHGIDGLSCHLDLGFSA